jgi:DNA-binding NarL/FixJ family response regulator
VTRIVKVLIADDHDAVRELLRDRLEQQVDISVAAHVGDADAAVNAATEVKPDVVLMDIDMPGLSAFDGAARITARCPDCRIIFFTAFVRDHYIEKALAAQAWGYVTKTERPETILKAVRSVADGFTYFSPAVQQRLVMTADGVRLRQPEHARISSLTPRESEVLCYLAKGMAKKEIAQAMSVAVKTVDYYCTEVMNKLAIHDRVELARYAIREGLIEP